jgi:hypothetical protein
VDWESFQLQMLQEIVRCVGGAAMASVCGCLAEDYSAWMGGMPDLLLWNPGELPCFFAVTGDRPRVYSGFGMYDLQIGPNHESVLDQRPKQPPLTAPVLKNLPKLKFCAWLGHSASHESTTAPELLIRLLCFKRLMIQTH